MVGREKAPQKDKLIAQVRRHKMPHNNQFGALFTHNGQRQSALLDNRKYIHDVVRVDTAPHFGRAASGDVIKVFFQ